MQNTYNIPEIIIKTVETLTDNGFEAYLVGGCVRSLMLHVKPKDWDITTNAQPPQIQRLFKKSIYENKFGTVAVINEGIEDQTLKMIEITPYRLESKYSDKRRPDQVSFTKNIEDDLKRRDFTINAMALSLPTQKKEKNYKLIDLFEGQKDLKNKVIKTVGSPDERFNEDALRILRAIRLSTELDFSVARETKGAIKKHAHSLVSIAPERIKDEFIKIIMSEKSEKGMELMREAGILKYIAPELEDGYGVEQNKAHKFTVWEHNLLSLKHAASKKWPMEIRMASLLHDVGKPATRRWDKKKKDWTFYGHDVVGAKMSAKILSRLKFSKKTIGLIAKLIRYHLFFSDTEKITLSAVRRIVRNVGTENVWDLMKVRFADRIGMGRPKETPYRLRKYESMIDEAMRAPLSVTALKINGEDLMQLLKIKPSPKVGHILHMLFDEVLDDPNRNTKKYLEEKAQELNKLGDAELDKLGKKAKDRKAEREAKEIKEIRQKWWVK